MEAMFSVNDYDQDGDVMKKAFFLHFGGTRVMVADTLEDFKAFHERVGNMIEEISENYPDA